MKKLLTTILAAFIMLLTIMPTALSAQEQPITNPIPNIINIIIEDKPITFNNPPRMINGHTMVPLEEFLVAIHPLFHLSIRHYPEHNAYSVGVPFPPDGNGTSSLALFIDSTIYRWGFTEHSAQAAPTYIEGVVFVPIRILADRLPLVLEWHGESRTITIPEVPHHIANSGRLQRLLEREEIRLEPTEENIAMLKRELFDLINEHRVNHGAEPFIWSDVAHQAARVHSQDIVDNREFWQETGQSRHLGSDGSSVRDRILRINPSFVGGTLENITTVNFNRLTARSAFGNWHASPGHNANMLNTRLSLTHAGIGIALNERGDGVYVTLKVISQ